MTQDMEDRHKKLSSRNGRYWLRDMQSSQYVVGVESGVSPRAAESVDEQLPFVTSRSFTSSQIGHESVVVSIPDVGTAEKKRPSRARVASENGQEARQSNIVAPIPMVPAPKTGEVRTSKSSGDEKVGASAESPLAENFSESIEESVGATTTRKKSDDAITASRAGQTAESMDSIAKIANSVVAEFPVASPSLVSFVGSQVGLHTDETCARVAAELGGKGLGRVLLIDSDFKNRRLSKASGMNSQAGLSEVMNIGFDWKKAILKSGSSQLDFMSAGNCPHQRWTPVRTLKEALAEMRSEYQFICVSAGDAHDAAASMWAGLADGAMLLVSAAHSNDSIARSAVAQLRKDGARIFGCVVTDVSESVA